MINVGARRRPSVSPWCSQPPCSPFFVLSGQGQGRPSSPFLDFLNLLIFIFIFVSLILEITRLLLLMPFRRKDTTMA